MLSNVTILAVDYLMFLKTFSIRLLDTVLTSSKPAFVVEWRQKETKTKSLSVHKALDMLAITR